MFDAQMTLPATDSQGRYFPEEHHVQFLQYIVEVFIGSCFVTTTGECRILLIRGEGGLIANSGNLRGLVNVAKAHYRVGSIRLEYLGEIELL